MLKVAFCRGRGIYMCNSGSNCQPYRYVQSIAFVGAGWTVSERRNFKMEKKQMSFQTRSPTRRRANLPTGTPSSLENCWPPWREKRRFRRANRIKSFFQALDKEPGGGVNNIFWFDIWKNDCIFPDLHPCAP